MKLPPKNLLGGRVRTALLIVGLSVGPVACARPPQVQSSQLPVQRVVIYRNGVAYFERGAEVREKQVKFRLREENVGDFLATLAIMERGGHSVKAASFPVVMEEADEPSVDPQLEAALNAWEGKKKDPRKLRDVTLELDGERHDLTVGYVAETPLWRPSYRLVVGENGQSSLQVWGIVQNQSGEDWTNVELALVAGAPIAFESTLGDPVIPRRPIVTDEGEVVMAVPESGRTLHQEAPPPEAPEEEMEMADEATADGEAKRAKKPAEKSAGDYQFDDDALGEAGSGADPQAAPRSAAAPRPSMDVASGQASRLAQIEVQSGATRYEVPHKVTIPDQSATMVLLVAKKVPGEAVHLYAPDPGVSDSFRHPFRVVRFTNASGGMLEKGPIAVFEDGAFLGQGVLRSLPVEAQATVPFALVRDLAIEKSSKYEQRDVRFYAVRNGALIVEQDQAQLTTYEIQNGDDESAKLLVKHPRSQSAVLHDPPSGTKDDLSEGVAFVPVRVPRFGKATLVVDEREPRQSPVSWDSIEARRAIGRYLESGKATAEHNKALRAILQLAETVGDAADEQRKLQSEQRELEKKARETRLSLEAIEKNPRAGQLRADLTQRLAATTARLDDITKQLVELNLERSEAEVRLKDLTQSLEIPAAKPAGAPAATSPERTSPERSPAKSGEP